MANTAEGSAGWYVIDLQKKYRVLYVIMYPYSGNRVNGYSVGLTNNFNSATNGPLNKNELCATSTKQFQSFDPETLYCKKPYLRSRYVMFQQGITNGQFSVDELEVYGSEIYDDKHLGCYSNIEGTHKLDVAAVEQCSTQCTAYQFFVIKNGKECSCLNYTSLPSPLISSPLSNCNLTCSDDGYMCGGFSYYSLYSVKDCALNAAPASSTLSFQLNLLSSGQCIITTHCSAGATAGSDVCPSQSCVTGWNGDVCDDRALSNSGCVKFCSDCSVNSGSCGIHTCVSVTTGGTNTMSECKCMEGYYKTTYREDCKDLNECMYPSLNKCDNATTSCSNTAGSYECACLSGYEKKSDIYSCQEIDECLTTCKQEFESCFNTVGSHSCECISGYERDNKDTCIVFSSSKSAIIGGVVGGSLGLIVIIGLTVAFVGKTILNKLISNLSFHLLKVKKKSDRIKLDRLEGFYKEHSSAIQKQFKQIPLINPDEPCEHALKANGDHTSNTDYSTLPYHKLLHNYCPLYYFQDPQADTVSNFWRMIVEIGIKVIVMFGSPEEYANV
ncbi:hypothetical protein HELRODRAFT_163144 [Helobdella robusta]|uniref:EGF-like domain-containing protein n=1 Tax=Helobdella robusta TaxID=6412 RepID=T1ETQ2_HELRO|nr:hypothetical protein HELRODRAFT_163144 [Helobdella robusta]ESN96116.1 hypothetical protein HELRODRAFT_163144 [Helobdella robusta]